MISPSKSNQGCLVLFKSI